MLVKVPISGNIPPSDGGSINGGGGSKLGFVVWEKLKKLESGKLNNVDAEVDELAEAKSAVAIVAVDGVVLAVVEAVRLELSLLELELDFRSLAGASAEGFGLECFAFRQPPPTGTLRRTPPLVQYRRQFLQKWRGWERL